MTDMPIEVCDVCRQVQRVPAHRRDQVASCARCAAQLDVARGRSLAVTGACSLAALILFVPANLYPVMTVRSMGASTENTIWSGVRALADEGMWGVAAIVFGASILVPLVKLAVLGWLVLSAGSGRLVPLRAGLLRAVELIGRWSMLDVFLLAILVAALKLGDVASVAPGPGLAIFATVVVLTMIASACFDPRALWQSSQGTPA